MEIDISLFFTWNKEFLDPRIFQTNLCTWAILRFNKYKRKKGKGEKGKEEREERNERETLGKERKKKRKTKRKEKKRKEREREQTRGSLSRVTSKNDLAFRDIFFHTSPSKGTGAVLIFLNSSGTYIDKEKQINEKNNPKQTKIITVAPWKGCRPERRTYVTTPTPHTSTSAPYRES